MRAGTLTLLGALLLGCSQGWIDAARQTVDGLNAATQIAWQEYARQATDRCSSAVSDCAQAHRGLDECQGYDACIRAVKTTAQAVIAFHGFVEQARQALDAIEANPGQASELRAQQLYRLVLKHALSIADSLSQQGVPMDVAR